MEFIDRILSRFHKSAPVQAPLPEPDANMALGALMIRVAKADKSYAVEEIVKIDGIDGLIIGPYDLSASLGYPGKIERAEMKEMIDKFQRTCIKAGKAFGEHIVHPDKLKLDKTIESGARFIAYGTDFNFMIKGLGDEFQY